MVKRIALQLMTLCLTVAAHGQIRVTLGPETTVTLPGVRPELIITLENVGSDVAQVDARFGLRVWPLGAEEPFIASADNPENVATFPWFHPDALQPGESAELYLVQNIAGSPWFCESELNQPGEVRLQISTPHGDSNWVTMVVTEPEGRDAEVWEIIKAHPGCYPFGLGQTIWNGYRDSSYGFFVQPPTGLKSAEERIAIYEEQIAMRPEHPLSDFCRLLQVRAQQELAGRFVDNRELDQALVHADAAREILDSLAQSRDIYVRTEAAKLLKRNYTAESIQREDQLLYGPPVLEVWPACFSPTEKGFDVLFASYRTKKPLDLPVGVDNKFTPPPFDRGQPTRFLQGNVILPWRLQYEGKEPQLVWHLNGENIKISAQEAEKLELPPCPARDADTEEWWWDEMERRGY
jgi:hypothetical protein